MLHISHYMHWHAIAWARGFCEEKTICQVVLWSGFVWSFFSQGATCNIMSSEFSLCQVAGVNARATVHFWDWYVLVKKILPQLPEILPQLTQGKWFVLGTWFLTRNIFTSDQKCLSAYEIYEALIFKYQDSQLPRDVHYYIYVYIYILSYFLAQNAPWRHSIWKSEDFRCEKWWL